MKGILVDLGKTIVDNYGYDFKRALFNVYKHTNKEATLEEFLRKESYLRDYIFKHANKTDTEVCLTNYLKLLLEMCEMTTNYSNVELEEFFFDEITKDEGLIEDVLLILDYFKNNNYIIIALSNSCISGRTLKRGLEKLNVLHYFTDVLSSSDYLFRKPRIEFFEYGIYELKKRGALEIYFLGNDYKCDIIGSSNALVYPIWINHEGEENKLNIDLIEAQNYKQLLEKLKNNEM